VCLCLCVCVFGELIVFFFAVLQIPTSVVPSLEDVQSGKQRKRKAEQEHTQAKFTINKGKVRESLIGHLAIPDSYPRKLYTRRSTMFMGECKYFGVQTD
jgi:hypothetical protein